MQPNEIKPDEYALALLKEPGFLDRFCAGCKAHEYKHGCPAEYRPYDPNCLRYIRWKDGADGVERMLV